MKTRRIVLIFSLILCLGMLVACNADVAEQNAGDKLAYATFKNDSKGFSVAYDGYKSFDDLYWYYKANKLDDYGQSGDTDTLYAKVPGNTQTGKGLDGKTEALSEGKWQFTLKAFETALPETETGSKRYDAEGATQSAIYSGSTPAATEEGVIVIRRNQTNYIPVTVTPVAENGHIKFTDAYYEWETAGSNEDPDVKITITIPVSFADDPIVITKTLEYATSNYPISGYIWLNGLEGTIADSTPGEGFTNDIPAGVYAASIVITPVNDEDSIIFADQNLSLKVFGGLTATISGSLIELLSLENYFAVPEVDVKVFNPDPTSEAGTVITSNYVAKDEKTNETTTVTFPQGALTSTNQHSLEVEVFSAAVSESKFVIETETTGSQAVAGLDLTLKKVTRTSEGAVTEETVEEFENGKYATIVTYINPGLEDVAVRYNGTDKEQPIATTEDVTDKTVAKELDTDSGLGYNPTTGYLSFKTNHFSEYYVQATVYVQNVTTGKYYHSLRDALDDSQENQTIKLLKNTETGSSYTIGQPFYVNTKGLTLDLNQQSLTVTNKFSFVIEADDVTVKNGNVVSGSDSGKASGIHSYVLVVNKCKNVVLDGLTVTGGVSAGGSTGETPNAGAAHNMVMRNCTVTGGDWYAICSQNLSDVTIESGTYSETSASVTSKGVLQGHFVGLDGPEGSIIVVGGRFNGKINTENTNNEIVLKGGIFDHDPSDYVAEGYVAEALGTNPETWEVVPTTPQVSVVEDGASEGETMSLASFRNKVNAGNSYAGYTVTLLDDVDLEGIEWTPIGTYSSPFKGILDGDGKTIKNLSIISTHQSGGENHPETFDRQGLFGLTSNATIKNLNMQNIDVSSTDTSEGMIGGLIGEVKDSLILDHVTIDSDSLISGGKYAGGLIGCERTQTDTTGILVSINNCVSSAVVQGQRVGGFFGRINHVNTIEYNLVNRQVIFTHCLFGGSARAITGSTKMAGGFVGQKTGANNNQPMIDFVDCAILSGSIIEGDQSGQFFGFSQSAFTVWDCTIDGVCVVSPDQFVTHCPYGLMVVIDGTIYVVEGLVNYGATPTTAYDALDTATLKTDGVWYSLNKRYHNGVETSTKMIWYRITNAVIDSSKTIIFQADENTFFIGTHPTAEALSEGTKFQRKSYGAGYHYSEPRDYIYKFDMWRIVNNNVPSEGTDFRQWQDVGTDGNTGFVLGAGYYFDNPTEYVPEGYNITQSGNVWTVTAN